MLAIPASLLLGCTTTKLDPIRVDAPSVAEAAIAGPGVDISNLRGNITLRVDDRAERISVTPTVRLDKGGPEHFDLNLVADSVDVTAEVQDRGGLPAVVITTTSTSDPNGFFVDLEIRLPAAEGLRIRSGGGAITVVDVAGAIDIENVGGTVEVRTSKPVTQPVAISTGSGNVYLLVPPQSQGDISMQAFGGRCRLESLTAAASLVRVHSDERSLTGSLNAGSNPIEITTADGDCRMWVLEEPLDLRVQGAFFGMQP